MASVESAPRHRGAVAVSDGLKRAVLYLRVSTTAQVNTDYDPEGISIPAQRQACERKVESLGAQIVATYVEPGKTATSIEKRPVFQEMLARIKAEKDVDFVIVYHFNRIFRNSIDAAITKKELGKAGVRVVSTVLDMGESPESSMVESIIHAVDQYQSQASGADISYKMSEKARRGGTLGRARLGYLNTRDHVDGREIRVVTPDPERAHLITLAFELYASGAYTLERLSQTLTDQGLRTRPSRRPAGPISTSSLHFLLQDRYYLGYVTYKGKEFPGRHEALVSPEVFELVQEIMTTRTTSGTRQRVYHHYLKGILWCGACHERGTESRMILQRSLGNGGEYFYFFCRGLQRHDCDTRYTDVETIEELVELEYHRLKLDPDFAAFLRAELGGARSDQQRLIRLRRSQLLIELERLDRQEANLVDLLADGQAPSEVVRTKLQLINDQRVRFQFDLDQAGDGLSAGADLIEHALKVAEDPYELYRRMGPEQRRLFNRAVFERIYIYEDQVSGRKYKEPFNVLVPASEAYKDSMASSDGGTPSDEVGETLNAHSSPVQFVQGSSKAFVVEAMGLEPTNLLTASQALYQLSYAPSGEGQR